MTKKDNALPDSAKEVARLASKLLVTADIDDTLPTPEKHLIECANLVLIGDLSLDKTLLQKLSRGTLQTMKKIRGILDKEDRTIYVDPTLHPKAQTHTRFHEVGHKILPWHYDLIYLDDDETINPRIEKQMESEANLFAAEIRFQGKRFSNEIRDLEIGIPAIMYMADRYGASYHASIRRYVEVSTQDCAVLVLKPGSEITEGSQIDFLEVSYALYSKSFIRQFGPVKWPHRFPMTHAFSQIRLPGFYDVYGEGDIMIRDCNGENHLLNFQTMDNTFNVFVLVFRRSLKSARKKVIMS